MAGVPVRSDIVDVYIFQRVEAGRKGPEPQFASERQARSRRGHNMGDSEPGFPKPTTYFLQLLRAHAPLAETWHPVMGHMDLDAAGRPETARACAERELREETGLSVADEVVQGFWSLEQVHPYFVQAINAIVLSPRFAVEVSPGWQPRLNDEHSRWRWVAEGEVGEACLWPGQRHAIEEVLESLVRLDAPEREHLRVR